MLKWHKKAMTLLLSVALGAANAVACFSAIRNPGTKAIFQNKNITPNSPESRVEGNDGTRAGLTNLLGSLFGFDLLEPYAGTPLCEDSDDSVINWLLALGLMNTDIDGDFNPDAPVNLSTLKSVLQKLADALGLENFDANALLVSLGLPTEPTSALDAEQISGALIAFLKQAGMEESKPLEILQVLLGDILQAFYFYQDGNDVFIFVPAGSTAWLLTENSSIPEGSPGMSGGEKGMLYKVTVGSNGSFEIVMQDSEGNEFRYPLAAISGLVYPTVIRTNLGVFNSPQQNVQTDAPPPDTPPTPYPPR